MHAPESPGSSANKVVEDNSWAVWGEEWAKAADGSKLREGGSEWRLCTTDPVLIFHPILPSKSSS